MPVPDRVDALKNRLVAKDVIDGIENRPSRAERVLEADILECKFCLLEPAFQVAPANIELARSCALE